MTTAEMNQVAAQYRQERDSLTEKEKAVRERALWAMAGPVERKTSDKRAFLLRVLGEAPYQTEGRQAILNLGDAGDPFWKRVGDKQMLLNTASKLARKARTLAGTSGCDMERAVSDVLAEYDALPFVRIQDGVPYRFASSSSKSAAPPEIPVAFPSLEGRNREFWMSFRATVSSYLEKQCDGIDPSTREILKRDFETDMKVIVDQFLAVVRREQGRGKAQAATVTTALARTKVFEACEILHMDPPQADGLVDLDKARRQKKLLARAYHPDSNGGDETTQDKYVEVIQAYQTLEAYSKQFNAGNPAHRGGDDS